MRLNNNCNDKLYRIIIFVMLCIILTLVGYILYDQLNEHFNDRDPKLIELKKKLEILINQPNKKWTGHLESLNNRYILNEIKLYVGSKSYTINKTRIYMCIRDSNNHYYDDNSLMFVLLHEISHVICKSIGHTEEFHKIFEDLLVEAEKVGIYNSKIPMIKNYCGHD